MCDKSDIAQSLAFIAEAFPNFKAGPNTAEVYYQLLQDVPGDELKAAVLQCCGESGRAFAPSVGELRGAVSSIRQSVAGVPSSYEAWMEVRRAMAEIGSYRAAEWSHPLIEKTVRTMGWRYLCMSENEAADRAHFVKCYEQYVERSEREDMRPAPVKGYIESQQHPVLDVTAEMKKLADGMRK